jgi:hypothetical protein
MTITNHNVITVIQHLYTSKYLYTRYTNAQFIKLQISTYGTLLSCFTDNTQYRPSPPYRRLASSVPIRNWEQLSLQALFHDVCMIKQWRRPSSRKIAVSDTTTVDDAQAHENETSIHILYASSRKTAVSDTTAVDADAHANETSTHIPHPRYPIPQQLT